MPRNGHRIRAARRVLVLTYWGFHDALVQTYTLPYLRIMSQVLGPEGSIHLVTLERHKEAPQTVTGPGSISHVPFSYHRFGLRAMLASLGMLWKLLRLMRRERIDVIHCWCTPAGAIGYLLSLLTGKPLVIDSYEPHADAMVENGTWTRRSMAFRLLFMLERAQSHHATHLIAAAPGMERYASERYGLEGRAMYVKPACVDLDRFHPSLRFDPALTSELGLAGKLVAVYAGKFGGIYLDREVFQFFRACRDLWGERFHVLLLTGHKQEELVPFMQEAGTSEDMYTLRFVPHSDVPRHMGLAHFAITPVKPVPTKRYCTPVKDGEYWALGLPVVITPHISEDSDLIARHRIGCVLDSTGMQAYAKTVACMDGLLQGEPQEQLMARVRAVAEKHRHFSIAEKIYADIYGT